MNPIDILLVEDNEGDILLTVEALQEGNIKTRIAIARDGREAMDMLKRKGEYSLAPRPNLILLDINLPKLNGHELLNRIKQDEKLKAIPVIMLSTSSSGEEILKCYESHANCYITKPIDVEDFGRVMHKIEEFWLSAVELPRLND